MNSHSNQGQLGSGGKILTVTLGGHAYGIELLDSKEVIAMMAVEPIPQSPAFLLGMINLRGNLIPVMDLRIKLGLIPSPPTPESCIVIVDRKGRLLGALVDALIGVTTLEQGDYVDHPNLGEQVHTEFMKGIGKQRDHLIYILDLEKVFCQVEELATLEAT